MAAYKANTNLVEPYIRADADGRTRTFTRSSTAASETASPNFSLRTEPTEKR